MSTADSDGVNKGGAYFPQTYITDMFAFIKRNSDKVEVLTYQDFDWLEDFDYANGYPVEKKHWLSQIKSGEKDNSKAYLLIQYDLDSRPERAMSLLAHAEHDGVPANIMRFFKRIDRRRLKTSNELAHTDYDIDDGLLNDRIKEGFVVGYHSNCYERSHHHKDDAAQILEKDILQLKKQYDINFYTAHGGVPCDEGINNRDIAPPDETAKQVRWVHNGATPFFNKQFSDGGHNSPQRDPAGRDLRDFVAQMQPGGRYRILIHPQYYATNYGVSKRYSGTVWYDEMLSNLAANSSYDTWAEVDLEKFESLAVGDRLKQSEWVPSAIRNEHGIKWLAKQLWKRIFR